MWRFIMKDFSNKELAWINRLQKCLDAQPESLRAFDNESGIAIYKAKELPMSDTEAVDNFVKHELVNPKQGHWDCGAW